MIKAPFGNTVETTFSQILKLFFLLKIIFLYFQIVLMCLSQK
jgi:hypothetical protein